MNWVGGLKDKARRQNEVLLKQKEYFEKKRFASYKKKKTKSNKKGISRDLLNLACISKTVRNPFDEDIGSDNKDPPRKFTQKHKQLPKTGCKFMKTQSATAVPRNYTDSEHFKCEHISHDVHSNSSQNVINDEDIFFRPLKVKPKPQSAAFQRKLPLCHSTPLPFQNFATQRYPYPTHVQHNPCMQTDKRGLPSPIYSQKSFAGGASFHPISIQTDEEILLQQTSPFVEPERYTTQSQSAFHKSTQSESPAQSFSDFLHGVPSDSFHIKQESVTPNAYLQNQSEQLAQYELLKRSLPPESSSNASRQEPHMNCSATERRPIDEDSVYRYGLSGSKMEGGFCSRIKERFSSEEEIENEDIFLPCSRMSSIPSVGSLSGKLSSGDSGTTICRTPTPTTPPKQGINDNAPFVELDLIKTDKTSLNQLRDVSLQTESEKFVSRMEPLKVDVATSPIVWSFVDAAVQTDAEE